MLTFRKLILYFSTPIFYFKKQQLLDKQPRLRTWIIFGPMESGKTTFVKTVLFYQNKLLETYGITYRNVQFFDVESFIKGLATNWKSTVINFFIDDAVFIADSRASMSKINQILTQMYFYIRHYVEHYSRQTVLINVFWSAQSVTAIDKRIRDTATVVVLKGMMRTNEKILREYFYPSIVRKMQLLQIMSTINDNYKSFFAVSLQKNYSKILKYTPKPLVKFEEFGIKPEFKLQNILDPQDQGEKSI
jgi:hypothetical protein